MAPSPCIARRTVPICIVAMLPTIAMTPIVTIVSISETPRSDRAWCTMVLVMLVGSAIPRPSRPCGRGHRPSDGLEVGYPRGCKIGSAIGTLDIGTRKHVIVMCAELHALLMAVSVLSRHRQRFTV